MNVITNPMLQVSSIFYYITVHKKIEILGTVIVLLWTPKNSVKNRNKNGSFTCKSINIVARCQICKIYFRTPFIRIMGIFLLWR